MQNPGSRTSVGLTRHARDENRVSPGGECVGWRGKFRVINVVLQSHTDMVTLNDERDSRLQVKIQKTSKIIATADIIIFDCIVMFLSNTEADGFHSIIARRRAAFDVPEQSQREIVSEFDERQNAGTQEKRRRAAEWHCNRHTSLSDRIYVRTTSF